MRTLLFILITFLLQSATGANIDSLISLTKSGKDDTSKVKNQVLASQQLREIGLYDSSLKFAHDALALSEELFYKKGMADAHNQMGTAYLSKGEYKEAMSAYKAALNLYTILGDKRGIGSATMSVGTSYDNMGNSQKALERYMMALKIFEEFNDQRYISMLYNNIGVINYTQKNYDKAMEYLIKSLQISEEHGLRQLMSQQYNGIANVYYAQGNFKEALEYYKKSLSIAEELKIMSSIIFGNYNIGVALEEMNNPSAIDYYQKALKMAVDLGDKYSESASLMAIGAFLSKQHKYSQGIDYLKKGIEIAEQNRILEYMSEGYKNISVCYEGLGSGMEALKYHKLHLAIKDTLMNETSNRNIQQMQAIYETEKKDQQITLLNKEKETQAALTEANNRQKNTVIYSVIFGLVMVITFSIFLFNKFRTVRNQNTIIEMQKKLVEDKNKEIIDSINYAKRIQQLMLPTEKYIEKTMNSLR